MNIFGNYLETFNLPTMFLAYEPQREKKYIVCPDVLPTNQIRLRIHAVWSESSLSVW